MPDFRFESRRFSERAMESTVGYRNERAFRTAGEEEPVDSCCSQIVRRVLSSKTKSSAVRGVSSAPPRRAGISWLRRAARLPYFPSVSSWQYSDRGRKDVFRQTFC